MLKYKLNTNPHRIIIEFNNLKQFKKQFMFAIQQHHLMDMIRHRWCCCYVKLEKILFKKLLFNILRNNVFRIWHVQGILSERKKNKLLKSNCKNKQKVIVKTYNSTLTFLKLYFSYILYSVFFFFCVKCLNI